MSKSSSNNCPFNCLDNSATSCASLGVILQSIVWAAREAQSGASGLMASNCLCRRSNSGLNEMLAGCVYRSCNSAVNLTVKWYLSAVLKISFLFWRMILGEFCKTALACSKSLFTACRAFSSSFKSESCTSFKAAANSSSKYLREEKEEYTSNSLAVSLAGVSNAAQSSVIEVALL